MQRAVMLVLVLAGTAHASPAEVVFGGNAFAVDDGGFVEAGACAIGDRGWSFYACLAIELGYQDSAAIITDAGELGARYRAGEHVSFTLGAGSSLITAALRGVSCVIGDSDRDGGEPVDCDWTALPLHAYPALGVHLHASRATISVSARYHLSERSPDGWVRAPYGLALGAGVMWQW